VAYSQAGGAKPPASGGKGGAAGAAVAGAAGAMTAGAGGAAGKGGAAGAAGTTSAGATAAGGAAGAAGTGAAAVIPPSAPIPRIEPVPLKKGAPPPPAPSAGQRRAFEILQEEARAYENGARDYRRTLTMIVRHHYEERRRRTLSALDREIETEKKGLNQARDEAIARLEKFIARYSGEEADPKATPDAMFRLAALYEERARGDFEAELGPRLEPAIALYRRLITEFPQYEESAAVHYYLGHAYTDAGRIEEGQQGWRALACRNKFSVKPDPADASKIELQKAPQDHDEKFWEDWGNRHPIPFDQAGLAAAGGKRAPARGGRGAEREELSFIDPYEGCEPIPQQTEAGEEPRYLAEVWWQIGNYHFDQIDPAAGPYNLNRAVTGYQHSMEYKRPPLYGVSLYKLAWTYFKQQRYHTAVDWFVKLLHYADEQQEKTGDPGADFRSEAYTYIAGSLTYVDFEGPPPEHPYIPRNDVLDNETDPLLAEQKMSIAIERVQDPKLIPQDKKWTVEIYKALAQEFIDITQNRNAIATLELTLKKFPMDRDAPVMQNRVAELYDQLSRLAPEGSEARAEYAAKALEARTRLAAYVGTTPWTDANRDDPEALEQAERLVRGGLQRAAADHTNYARAYYQKALELSDPNEQKVLIEKSIAEYRLADTAWGAYLAQDPNALDAYESRFWLADARYWVAVLQVAIGRSPRPEEVQGAREAAVAVRDSNEDDKYLQPSAYYLVTLSDKLIEDQYRVHQESNGSAGFEKRTAVKFSGEGENRKVVRDAVPQQVADAIGARDAYIARIPLDRDTQNNGLLYSFQSADYFFVYGHFDEARKRFQPIYDQFCGKNEYGYQAWEKLISMSNFEGDAARSRQLAEGKSCAFNEETKQAEESIRKPVKQGVAYLDARRLYEEAEKMPPGPERDKKWRQAAAAYKVALDAAPDRDEAPEAAMNGAYAYKQVGEYDKAIEMYELFISRYGNEQTLQKLRTGDPKAQPPVQADQRKYEERVKYLKGAHDALANANVLFFNYPRAADTFEKISGNGHFAQNDRREAARQALSLYSSIGDASGMGRARKRMGELGASPKDIAEADFIVASAEMKKWDEFSPDTGANANARRRAMTAMEEYYARNRNQDAAAQWVVHAAYNVAKTRRAAQANDTNKWWQSTIGAFEKYRRVAPAQGGQPTGTREAAMAAEGEYTLLDQEITRGFDYESGHHRYKGTPVEVVQRYQKDAVDAKRWYDKLQHVIDAYVSPDWTAVAISRQGSLYDSLRTGLYNTRPPELKMFDAKTEAMLKRAEESDNPDLQEKADEVRIKVQTAWREKRDQELDSADRIMVDRYSNAVVLARRYNVAKPEITRAIRRLAFVTDVIGEAKMKQYTSGVKDLNYTEGMFLKMRPGQVTTEKPQGTPPPLPVLAQ
jgi:hypothetical protein